MKSLRQYKNKIGYWENIEYLNDGIISFHQSYLLAKAVFPSLPVLNLIQ
jgi:hypothetical protein